MPLPAVAALPVFFGFLGGLLAKIFFAQLALRIIVIGAATILHSVLLTALTGLLPNLAEMNFHPTVYQSIEFLPANTATYLTICVAALVARWNFVSGMKALGILQGR